MPRQTVILVNNEIYHICHRAVGGSAIFLDQNDYYRGIFSLYEFNNNKPVLISIRRRDRLVEKKREKLYGVGDHTVLADSRDKLVDVLAFCFMPNHMHLLLRQVKDGGISKFIKKVGEGYANYFNEKHQRKGHLFNQFKAIHIKGDNQLKHVVTYIHCNPISLIEPGWKESGINDQEKVLDFLENKYRWSSLWDYSGKSNFQSVTSRNFLLEVVGQEKVKQEMKNWIAHKADIKRVIDNYESLFLE